MTKSLVSFNASHTLATLHSSFGSLFSTFAPNPHELRAYKITVIALTACNYSLVHFFTLHSKSTLLRDW